MLKQPYLIQRLELPHEYVNPFSFGGGLRNGGLSDEAMKLLKGIFSFDYMGSAEFEWGAVPESMQYIAKHNSEYLGFTITCKTKDGSNGEVYILCKSEDFKDIKKWIISKAYNEYGKNLHTKEYVSLQDAINKKGRTQGWLDIDNHFFFFINKEMFENTKKLFEIL